MNHHLKGLLRSDSRVTPQNRFAQASQPFSRTIPDEPIRGRERVNPAALNSFNYKMTMTENEAKAAADKIICVAIYLSGLRGVIATTGRKITSGGKRDGGGPLLSSPLAPWGAV